MIFCFPSALILCTISQLIFELGHSNIIIMLINLTDSADDYIERYTIGS